MVIFEWHPKLVHDTDCDPVQGFAALASANYTSYLWFNNVGTFSHFSGIQTRDSLQREIAYLLAVNQRADEHFDVIALPADSPIDEVKLAAMEYARNAAIGLHRQLTGLRGKPFAMYLPK